MKKNKIVKSLTKKQVARWLTLISLVK